MKKENSPAPAHILFKRKKGSGLMYYGTKGWYVAELKKLGVRYLEGRKLESYRGHVLRNLLTEHQEKIKEK
nr:MULTISPECIES: YflJ family protein [Bacillus]